MNVNNDDKTWEYNNLLDDANGGTGIALYLYSWENPANDYMMAESTSKCNITKYF